jgi:hypothetical protein
MGRGADLTIKHRVNPVKVIEQIFCIFHDQGNQQNYSADTVIVHIISCSMALVESPPYLLTAIFAGECTQRVVLRAAGSTIDGAD